MIPCLNVVECGAKYIVCILSNGFAPSAYCPENQVCSFFGVVGFESSRAPRAPGGPPGDPWRGASSARVRAEMGGALRTMSSSLESRANRGPSAILFPGAASLPPSRLVQADTRTHPKGRKGCGGGGRLPKSKLKDRASGFPEVLRNSGRDAAYFVVLTLTLKTLFLSPLLRQYFLHCVLCDFFR